MGAIQTAFNTTWKGLAFNSGVTEYKLLEQYEEVLETRKRTSVAIGSLETNKADLASPTFTGTITIPTLSVTGNETITGDLAINGGDLTSTATTFNLLNATTTTLNIGGALTNLALANSSTATQNINIANGATISGSIKTINIGTGAVAGATTAIKLGSTTGTSTITLQGNTSNTGTLSVTGATTLGSTLSVTGTSTLTGTLNANGGVSTTSISASSTFSVTGASTLTGLLTANGGISTTTISASGVVTLASTLAITGNTSLSTLSASGIITSTLATGTAPLTVASTTKVSNLNVDLLDGYHADVNGNTNTIALRGTSIGNIQVTGLSTSWGFDSGINTGGINVITGTGAGATWLISGTNTGAYKGGLQLLDSGANIRLYALTGYLDLSSSGVISSSGGYSGSVNATTITTSSNLSVTGTSTLTGALTANGGITTTTLNATGNVTVGGNVTVTGTLTVNGGNVTVNATTVTVDDPIMTLGGDTAPTLDDNKDRGIEFRWHNGTTAKVGFFGFDDSTGKFTFIPDATNTSEVFSGTAGTIVSNLEGNVTGAVTGNASTATSLSAGSVGALPYQSATGTTAYLSAGTSGMILKSNGASAPSWSYIDLSVNAPDMSFKKTVRVATTTDLGASTFASNILTGYTNSQSLACTTTSASTTVTTTSTAGLKVGAIISTPTIYLAGNTTVASITSATTFTVTNIASTATTAITGTGTTATATFTAKTYVPFAVGSSITITGATPSTYNGTFVVTACTTSSVSWASIETVSATVQGNIAFVIGAGTSITTAFTQSISALSIDGITMVNGDRVLVKDMGTLGGLINTTSPAYNGIYTVTNIGSTSVAWVLTRTSDANVSTYLDSALVNISEGTINGGKTVQTYFKGTDTLNTTPIYWNRLADVSASETIGTPITATGIDIAIGTETRTLIAGAVTDLAINSFGIKTIKSTSASTYTRASTLYIAGAPIASTNATITTPYALYIAGGNSYMAGNLSIGGTLTNTGAVTLSSTLAVTGNTTLTGDLAVNGGDITTTSTTFNLATATATTINAFGAGTNIDLGYTNTSINLRLANGATTTGLTKNVYIGANGASGSITNVSLGSSIAGATSTIILNGNTTNTGTLTSTGNITSSGIIIGTTLQGNISQSYVLDDNNHQVERTIQVKCVAITSTIPSTLTAIDGYTPIEGDLVLLASSAGGVNDGIYVVQASGTTWTRYSLFSTEAHVVDRFIKVFNGTTYKNTYWTCVNKGSITVGTTALKIQQQFGDKTGAGLTLSAQGVLSVTSAPILTTARTIGTLTGDVTTAGSTFNGSANNTNVTVIANNAVTNAKQADMATMTMKGNNTGATSDPIDLTVSQVDTMLQITKKAIKYALVFG